MASSGLSWLQILRLALVQTGLGAMVVLTTSTMNRVMVVELAFPAIVPGALVGIHYALQMMRPLFGHGSDGGRRRTPFIVGGLAVLGLGAVGASGATALMAHHAGLGIIAGIVAFVAIGAGVGAAGTNLLTLVATHVAADRRGPAATLIWMMMIFGFVVTTGVVGQVLDPYTPERLIAVTAVVCLVAFAVAVAALAGIEKTGLSDEGDDPARAKPAFRDALAEVWGEPATRRFTVFVVVSMLAYAGQDLILEPFAGIVFSMTPGETTALSSAQHGGTFLGMLLVAAIAPVLARRFAGVLTGLSVAGCLASALALAALAISGVWGGPLPIVALVFALGVGNGVFAVAAIAKMMALTRDGARGREGVRMGVWGAAQAIAFGAGGFLGTVAVDLASHVIGRGSAADAGGFACEALLFVVSARLVVRVVGRRPATAPPADETTRSSNEVVAA